MIHWVVTHWPFAPSIMCLMAYVAMNACILCFVVARSGVGWRQLHKRKALLAWMVVAIIVLLAVGLPFAVLAIGVEIRERWRLRRPRQTLLRKTR